METITIYVDKVGMIKDEIRKALGNQMRADAYKGNNIKYNIRNSQGCIGPVVEKMI